MSISLNGQPLKFEFIWRTHRHTKLETDRQTDRQTDRHTKLERDRQTDTHTYRHTKLVDYIQKGSKVAPPPPFLTPRGRKLDKGLQHQTE
uniref:Uncharacterized protein n=1 Tax=Haemonchus contortus TaxID=6289 RepID=A0A7I4Z273_HAECO